MLFRSASGTGCILPGKDANGVCGDFRHGSYAGAKETSSGRRRKKPYGKDGCVYGVKTFLPVLLTQDDPGIINVDSSAALMTLAGTSMYSSSKAALKGFTEALRVEFKGKCYVGLVCPGFTKTDIFRDQSNAGGKGQKVMDMISTDCDLMVKMIMFGIEHKRPMMVHGLDAHAMSIFNRLLPVAGSELFSAIMKMADIDLFSEVFDD